MRSVLKPGAAAGRSRSQEGDPGPAGRVGFDTARGYLPEPENVFVTIPDEMQSSSRLTAVALTERLRDAEPPVVLDVRNQGERDQGAIPDSLHIPLAELPKRLDEVPKDRPVVVYCASGYRSSVAASLLRAEGLTDVSDLLGGYTAFEALQQTV